MLEIRTYPLKHSKTLPDTALNAGATVKKCDKKFQLRLLLRFLRGELDIYIITMLLPLLALQILRGTLQMEICKKITLPFSVHSSPP